MIKAAKRKTAEKIGGGNQSQLTPGSRPSWESSLLCSDNTIKRTSSPPKKRNHNQKDNAAALMRAMSPTAASKARTINTVKVPERPMGPVRLQSPDSKVMFRNAIGGLTANSQVLFKDAVSATAKDCPESIFGEKTIDISDSISKKAVNAIIHPNSGFSTANPSSQIIKLSPSRIQSPVGISKGLKDYSPPRFISLPRSNDARLATTPPLPDRFTNRLENQKRLEEIVTPLSRTQSPAVVSRSEEIVSKFIQEKSMQSATITDRMRHSSPLFNVFKKTEESSPATDVRATTRVGSSPIAPIDFGNVQTKSSKMIHFPQMQSSGTSAASTVQISSTPVTAASNTPSGISPKENTFIASPARPQINDPMQETEKVLSKSPLRSTYSMKNLISSPSLKRISSMFVSPSTKTSENGASLSTTTSNSLDKYAVCDDVLKFSNSKSMFAKSAWKKSVARLSSDACELQFVTKGKLKSVPITSSACVHILDSNKKLSILGATAESSDIDNCIEFVAPEYNSTGKTFYFQCSSMEKALQWCELIEQIIAKLQPTTEEKSPLKSIDDATGTTDAHVPNVPIVSSNPTASSDLPSAIQQLWRSVDSSGVNDPRNIASNQQRKFHDIVDSSYDIDEDLSEPIFHNNLIPEKEDYTALKSRDQGLIEPDDYDESFELQFGMAESEPIEIPHTLSPEQTNIANNAHYLRGANTSGVPNIIKYASTTNANNAERARNTNTRGIFHESSDNGNILGDAEGSTCNDAAVGGEEAILGDGDNDDDNEDDDDDDEGITLPPILGDAGSDNGTVIDDDTDDSDFINDNHHSEDDYTSKSDSANGHPTAIRTVKPSNTNINPAIDQKKSMTPYATARTHEHVDHSRMQVSAISESNPGFTAKANTQGTVDIKPVLASNSNNNPLSPQDVDHANTRTDCFHDMNQWSRADVSNTDLSLQAVVTTKANGSPQRSKSPPLARSRSPPWNASTLLTNSHYRSSSSCTSPPRRLQTSSSSLSSPCITPNAKRIIDNAISKASTIDKAEFVRIMRLAQNHTHHDGNAVANLPDTVKIASPTLLQPPQKPQNEASISIGNHIIPTHKDGTLPSPALQHISLFASLSNSSEAMSPASYEDGVSIVGSLKSESTANPNSPPTDIRQRRGKREHITPQDVATIGSRKSLQHQRRLMMDGLSTAQVTQMLQTVNENPAKYHYQKDKMIRGVTRSMEARLLQLIDKKLFPSPAKSIGNAFGSCSEELDTKSGDQSMNLQVLSVDSPLVGSAIDVSNNSASSTAIQNHLTRHPSPKGTTPSPPRRIQRTLSGSSGGGSNFDSDSSFSSDSSPWRRRNKTGSAHNSKRGGRHYQLREFMMTKLSVSQVVDIVIAVGLDPKSYDYHKEAMVKAVTRTFPTKVQLIAFQKYGFSSNRLHVFASENAETQRMLPEHSTTQTLSPSPGTAFMPPSLVSTPNKLRIDDVNSSSSPTRRIMISWTNTRKPPNAITLTASAGHKMSVPLATLEQKMVSMFKES